MNRRDFLRMITGVGVAISTFRAVFRQDVGGSKHFQWLDQCSRGEAMVGQSVFYYDEDDWISITGVQEIDLPERKRESIYTFEDIR